MMDRNRCVVVRFFIIMSCLAGKPRQLFELSVCFPVVVVHSIEIATGLSLVVYTALGEQLIDLHDEPTSEVYSAQTPIGLLVVLKTIALSS